MQVNLNSVFTLSRDIGRHMLESRGGVAGEEAKPEGAADSNPRGRGKIINVASLLSYQGGITVPAYTAAKHGVMGITKALSNEWVSKGINVNAVAPGMSEWKRSVTPCMYAFADLSFVNLQATSQPITPRPSSLIQPGHAKS